MCGSAVCGLSCQSGSEASVALVSRWSSRVGTPCGRKAGCPGRRSPGRRQRDRRSPLSVCNSALWSCWSKLSLRNAKFDRTVEHFADNSLTQFGKEIVPVSRNMKDGIQQRTTEEIMVPVAQTQEQIGQVVRHNSLPKG